MTARTVRGRETRRTWTQVTKRLTSGEEEEIREDGSIIYWPYETFVYDAFLSLLTPEGVICQTVTMAADQQGSRSRSFACNDSPMLLLADGRVWMRYCVADNRPAAQRHATFATVQNGVLTVELTDYNDVMSQNTAWHFVAAVGSDSILCRPYKWNDSIGVASVNSSTLKASLEFYRVSGTQQIFLYAADTIGQTRTTASSGMYYWRDTQMGVAGRRFYFGGMWSPEHEITVCRTSSLWTSGYRNGKAGEQYAGICGRSSDGSGMFGLVTPAEEA